MKAIVVLAALALISTGFADQLPVGRDDTTATELSAKPPMMTGPYPVAISFDHQWTANVFNILDVHGNVVFSWADDRWVCRERMTVSWSPDSAHIVLMDHAPRAPMFFAAQLRNGKWENVPIHLYDMWGTKVTDPKTPEYCRVTQAQLLNWVSPIMLQIQMNQSSDNSAEPEKPIRVEYVTSLQFEGE